MRITLFFLALLVGGCVVEAPPPAVVRPVVVQPAVPPPAIVSVYEEPPLVEPAPIAVGWAPPPMLVEVPPPAPFPYSVWVGGYWVWQGNWVWAHGHWMEPPRPSYVWVHPYYEHRGGQVIFISGYWSAPGVAFVPPSPGLRLVVEAPAVGVIPGPRPIGPEGCFVPAPPGSRLGIIVPAPVGTAPAVVTSAPPVVSVGMRVTSNVTNVTNIRNTNVTNITNVNNVTNVTIVAPPAATASGRAFNSTVPAAPHLAAGRPAVVQARAPEPVNARHVMPFVPGRAPLTPAQGQSLSGAEPRPMLTREGPPGRNVSPAANSPASNPRLQPAAARTEGAPMPPRDAQVVRGGARPEPMPSRTESPAPARPMQAVSAPPPKTMPMKAAMDKAPGAGSAVPNNAPGAKNAPAHTDNAKSGKADAKKDAQGRQEGRHEQGKHEREGQ